MILFYFLYILGWALMMFLRILFFGFALMLSFVFGGRPAAIKTAGGVSTTRWAQMTSEQQLVQVLMAVGAAFMVISWIMSLEQAQ